MYEAHEITESIDDNYKWEIYQVNISPLNVTCGSYGDKFEEYSDHGLYVYADEHRAICQIYEDEIKRLKTKHL